MICGKCRLDLSTENFHKSSRNKSGYQYWCKNCRKEQNPEVRREYHKNRYHSNKEEWKDWFYKRNYNITLEDYNKMLEQQNNVCEICKLGCSTGRRLAVDHDHTNGKVRGLLCSNCNKALGCFKDNTGLLVKAIDYLKASRND